MHLKNDVKCCRPTKYRKIYARAFGARYTCVDTLYFSLERAKKRKHFRLRLWRTEKLSIFCTARRKRDNFLKRRWFCPPLEKFLRAPMVRQNVLLEIYSIQNIFQAMHNHTNSVLLQQHSFKAWTNWKCKLHLRQI